MTIRRCQCKTCLDAWGRFGKSIVGAKMEVYEAKSKDWQPMKTAPRDGTVIELWHVAWKCVVSCKWSLSISENLPWIEATLGICWPEESFTHWRKQSKPPEK